MNRTITAVAGLEAGHYTDMAHGTGCTVFICRDGAVGGVDVRGGSPGTRETDLLRPMHRVDKVHGVLLSGGSAFGLDAAAGVVNYLAELGIGFEAGPAVVPIVPAAILFDLNVINPRVRPGPAQGLAACRAAGSGPLEEGSVGAGTGATAAKSMGPGAAVKSGFGTASVTLPDGATVAAAVAVNAYGGIYDHRSGRLIAGPRRDDGSGFHDPVEIMLAGEAWRARLAHDEHDDWGGRDGRPADPGRSQLPGNGQPRRPGPDDTPLPHHVRRGHDVCPVPPAGSRGRRTFLGWG